jgi:hypothetical protein
MFDDVGHAFFDGEVFGLFDDLWHFDFDFFYLLPGFVEVDGFLDYAFNFDVFASSDLDYLLDLLQDYLVD